MKTVIIGAGAIGLTTAYHLAREGYEVEVIDARDPGLGASEVNAGWYCPAESVPVPGPGMVAQSLRWMLRPDSPLYIAPSLQPSFVKFMVGMWRKCNERDQRAGFIAQMDLAADTARLWDEYRADGIDFEMHNAGLLNTFLHAQSLEDHSTYLDTIRAHGFDPQVLVGDALRAHEPLMSDAVHSGIFFPHERHLDPGALMRSPLLTTARTRPPSRSTDVTGA
jgi:D-amino-acid dehydrogenase